MTPDRFLNTESCGGETSGKERRYGMKTLMIMGAGIYQVPLIKTAKRMGIHTIAVSIPGNYPGFAYADEVLHINTVDSGAVLKAAREKKIDGICTAGTDVAVMTIGRVNDAMGLSGISYEAARLALWRSLSLAGSSAPRHL